jgi:ATP-dependent DNA helicase RecG
MVNHGRLREISTEHPADITKMLARLVRDGFLVPDGIGRGMVYFVPWMSRPLASETFAADLPATTVYKTQELNALPQELASLPQELNSKRQELSLPIWGERAHVSDEEWEKLQVMALPVRQRGKVGTETMQAVISQLCRNHFIGLLLLSELLGRNEEHLRNRILNVMVNKRLLRRAFPRPNDPRQAYTSTSMNEKDTEE